VTLEASAIRSTTALVPNRVTIGPRLLRLRTDEQLVALFRAGHDEAFQVIYDRYHKRLEAYARRMLGGNHDAEDVLQEVFVRAYRALLSGDRELAVKAWLFRIVHNRCIDEIRRSAPPTVEIQDITESRSHDPAHEADARESLRRLLEDIGRLPEQQRSALLLRELSGISYSEVADVLDTSVPAVKSLLVRARMGLVRAGEARDTSCSEIREQLVEAHEQGVRASVTVRSHLRDCQSCRSYRHEIFLVRKRVAALSPVGPFAVLAKLIGLPGGGAGGTTSGAAPAAAVGGGGAASGAAIGAGHVVTLVAAAIASAGGAVGLQHMIAGSSQSAPAHRTASTHHRSAVVGAHPGTMLSPARRSARSYPAGRPPVGTAAYTPPDRSSSSSGSVSGRTTSSSGAGLGVDALISSSHGDGGSGQSGAAGGSSSTQTGSTGTGTGSGTGTSTGSGSGTTGSGSSTGTDVGPGASEGAGVGVTPPGVTGDGTSGSGSTSTGTTTTVGGTTASAGDGTGSSGSTTAGGSTTTGQGTTTTGTDTSGSGSSSTGTSASGSTS
jgi:RNA polymerase sigma factor (sigma-70 family)